MEGGRRVISLIGIISTRNDIFFAFIAVKPIGCLMDHYITENEPLTSSRASLDEFNKIR